MSDIHPPDRRKHGYSELEDQVNEQFAELNKKVDEQFEVLTKRLQKFFVKALIAFAIIGLAASFGLLGFGIVLSKQSTISGKIQSQRYNSLLESCNDQNNRHRKVIQQIDSTIAAIPPGKRKDRAMKTSVPFKLILGAAAPYTPDCKAYALRRVKGDR